MSDNNIESEISETNDKNIESEISETNDIENDNQSEINDNVDKNSEEEELEIDYSIDTKFIEENKEFLELIKLKDLSEDETFSDLAEICTNLKDISMFYGFKFMKHIKSTDFKTWSVIFHDTDYDLPSQFTDIVKDYTEITAVPLIKDPFTACEVVNNWTKERSDCENKITPEQIEKIEMISLYAMHFLDTWEVPFNPINTQKRSFFTKDGKIDVPMMSTCLTTEIYDKDNLLGIKLKMLNGSYIEIMMGLQETNLFRDNYIYDIKHVEVNLPKFVQKGRSIYKGNMDHSIDKLNLEILCENLKGMIVSTFDCSTVRFDENGLELKGPMTLTEYPEGMYKQSQNKIITFDHPFHYRIMKKGLMLICNYFDGK